MGFGGPPALIALMENEMVQKREWVSREYFMDMLAAINLVPGPNAVEMAIYLGYIYAGLPGLLLAGVFFLIPATLITLLIAIIYTKYGSLPAAQVLLYGITPMIIAIIIDAGLRIGKSALKNPVTITLGIVSFIAAISGINGIYIIFSAGILGIIYYFFQHKNNISAFLFFTPYTFLYTAFLNVNNRLIDLGLYFLKIGAVLFGSGFVLFAYIHDDVVNQFHWLTEKQLIDAIAVGQITPGPVSSAATFIGYIVQGVPGALLATFAMFLPSFIIIFLLGKILPKIRKSSIAQNILDSVNAAVVALIFSVAVTFFKSSINDLFALLLIAIGLFMLLKFKIDPVWMIIGGIIIGLFKAFI